MTYIWVAARGQYIAGTTGVGEVPWVDWDPNLVKLFFTNLKVKEDRLETTVKGVTMKITPSI